jgi:hypothetical protein
VQVLIGALVYSNNPEQTVELCDVDLDLTGVSDLIIGDRRSLIGSPGFERTPRRFGPRISRQAGCIARTVPGLVR